MLTWFPESENVCPLKFEFMERGLETGAMQVTWGPLPTCQSTVTSSCKVTINLSFDFPSRVFQGQP